MPSSFSSRQAEASSLAQAELQLNKRSMILRIVTPICRYRGRGAPSESAHERILPAQPDASQTRPAGLKIHAGAFLCALLSLAVSWLSSSNARANVYATNVKIDDGFTNVVAPAGTVVRISYILNEPASRGVIVQILADSTVVRTISLTNGSAGTLRGTNTISWNGTDNNSQPVAVGTYSVAITAASQGYPVWTQITQDSADGANVWEGRGIAVDQNTNSPYYGRIFVANAAANPQGPTNWLGYQVGILKCNADESYADEGGFSTGGYPWAGDNFSPWHLAVSRDDFVYIDDFTTNGQVIRWDPTISTNSQLRVLRPDNWPNLEVSLSGPIVFGEGTNTSLWMADRTFTTGSQIGQGILRYALGGDGACRTNDTGTTAVAVGGSLTGNPADVALDPAGNIYTIENRSETGDLDNRVYRFPPFSASTNQTGPITNADWAIGSGDDTMAGANGLAVDPSGTYVAIAFIGLSTGINGCTQIFYASNGVLVTNLDLGVTINGASDHEDQDCAWDAVGNVYYIDNIAAVWRAFSPPGTNQATTVALAKIQIGGAVSVTAPKITNISVAGGMVSIDFSAGTNDAASAFGVYSAPSVIGPFGQVAAANIINIGPGQFRATFPASGTGQYFRIGAAGTTPPPGPPAFTSITAPDQAAILRFSGASTDVPSSFTLLSSPTVTGVYSIVTNAIVTQIGPGDFQAIVPKAGPVQFYQVQK